MGWFKDLFIEPEVEEDPPLPVQVCVHGVIAAALWDDGQVCTWELVRGERLARFQAAGPRVALSEAGLVDGEGLVRDIQGAEIVRLPLAGVPRWLGERVLMLGWNRLWLGLPGDRREPQAAPGLDVSGAVRVAVEGGRAAILDPSLSEPWLLDLATGGLQRLSGLSAPVQGGCWFEGRLHTVQEGELVRWDQGSPEVLPARHGMQTLDVLPGARLTTLGLDASGQGELVTGQRRVALGKLPSSPRLFSSGLGPVVETWSGFELPEGPSLELPRRRYGRRPVVSLAVQGDHALVGCDPVCWYRLSDATCHFQLPSEPAP